MAGLPSLLLARHRRPARLVRPRRSAANPLRGVAVMVTAFVASFVVTWLLGYQQPSKQDVSELSQ